MIRQEKTERAVVGAPDGTSDMVLVERTGLINSVIRTESILP